MREPPTWLCLKVTIIGYTHPSLPSSSLNYAHIRKLRFQLLQRQTEHHVTCQGIL